MLTTLQIFGLFLAVGLGGCALVALHDWLERVFKRRRNRRRLLQTKAADVAEMYRRMR